MIGIAITHLDNQFYPDVLARFSTRFAQLGYRLVLFMTYGEADLDPVMDELLGYRLDGVILASSSLAARIAAECAEANVPALMFNSLDPDHNVPGIACDEGEGAALVARYLMAAGHDRLGIISGLPESSSSMARSHAFRAQVLEAGLDAPAEASGMYTFEGAAIATHRLLDLPVPPDGLFCINDHMALGALEALRDRGLRPGQDISIVGFDDVKIARWSAFSLTTFAQPVDIMVDTAIDALLGAIQGEPLGRKTWYIPGQLVIRDSARRAPGVVVDADGLATWLRPDLP